MAGAAGSRGVLGRLPQIGPLTVKCAHQLSPWSATSRMPRSRYASASKIYSSPRCYSASTASFSSQSMMSARSRTVTRSCLPKVASSVIRLPAQHEQIKQYRVTPVKSLNQIPLGSWDSHMHVVDPANYPLSPTAAYKPHPHLLSEAMKFESSVSLSNIVLVQPSIYGNDNSCMLDALEELGPSRGRAVVTFDPTKISRQTLQHWHSIGVRGVRINLKSVGRQVVASELASELQQYADVIRPFGWVIQLFIGLEALPLLEPLIPDLGVKVCIDHFGAPTIPNTFSISTSNPYSLPGFQSLVNLLEQGNTYVKLSAPYRLSTDGNQKDIEILAKEILRVAGRSRVVFATDWPHTRFDGVDIKPFAQKCLEWCEGDEVMIERLFRGNAEDLWDVKR